jgi:hypothetical protein
MRLFDEEKIEIIKLVEQFHIGVKATLQHIRDKLMHPKPQGKIKRYHQTLKNRILLEHYYSSEEL